MRHLEEGEIHAWLDGALDAAASGRVETHMAECADCAEAVAAARGLVAGASRILLSLDGVPGGVIPTQTAGPVARITGASSGDRDSGASLAASPVRPRRQPWFTRLPVRIAASLMLIAGVGVVATREGAAPGERDELPPLTEQSLSSPQGSASKDLSGTPTPASLPAVRTEAAPDAFGSRGRPGLPGSRAEAGQQPASVSNAVVPGTPPPAPRLLDSLQGKVAGIQVRQPEVTLPAGIPLSGGAVPTPVAPGQAMQQRAGAERRRLDAGFSADSTAGVAGARAGRTPTLSTIIGRVVSAADSTPLEGVTVQLVGVPGSTQTSADGRFTISGVRSGAYDLELRRVGFTLARISELPVVSGDTVPVTVTMTATEGLLLKSAIATGAGVPAGSITRIEPHPANRCFSLMLTERGDGRAFPPTGTIRLDVVPTPSVVGLLVDQVRQFGDPAARGAGGGGAAGGRGVTSATAAPPASRPSAAPAVSHQWGRLTADSIVVRWLLNDGPVTLRLRVTDDAVSGTAVAPSQPNAPRPARVMGTLVPCTGQ